MTVACHITLGLPYSLSGYPSLELFSPSQLLVHRSSFSATTITVHFTNNFSILQADVHRDKAAKMIDSEPSVVKNYKRPTVHKKNTTTKTHLGPLLPPKNSYFCEEVERLRT